MNVVVSVKQVLTNIFIQKNDGYRPAHVTCVHDRIISMPLCAMQIVNILKSERKFKNDSISAVNYYLPKLQYYTLQYKSNELIDNFRIGTFSNNSFLKLQGNNLRRSK